jgi:hypothetical protein
MVNPSLTYDNEYNRRLKEILTNYDDIESSRNSPTMVTGGMRLQSHIRSGTTPYDGREGTAPFSNTVTGGIRHPRMTHDMPNAITDMRYRGRVPKMPTRAEIEALKGGEMYGGNDAQHWGKFALDTGIKAWRLRNGIRNLTGYGEGGNRRRNTKEDATFWRNFGFDTAMSGLNLGEKGKNIFGMGAVGGRGRGKRANRKEDAVFWRDFADNTSNSMLNLGEKGKKLLGMGVGGRGRGKRANRKEDAVFWRNFADNTANSMLNLGEKGKKLFGMGPPKKIGKAVSARGAIVSKIMKEHGLSLPMASKYVKEHGLY